MIVNIKRSPRTLWVPIAEMRVSERAQRQFSQAHADMFAADFDLEAIGYPVVNRRDGYYWVVDGQHRVAALRQMGWGDQKIECEVYDGLTEAEEAELFLRRDKRRAVNAFEKFRIGVIAGRPSEVKIDKILNGIGLQASKNHGPEDVSAVETLRKIYDLGGPQVLTRTMETLRDTFGAPGYGAAFITGMGLVINRYMERIDQDQLVSKLSGLRGGPVQVTSKARQIQSQVGLSLGLCYAAAIVEIYNTGRGGKKITPFFRSDSDPTPVLRMVKGQAGTS